VPGYGIEWDRIDRAVGRMIVFVAISVSGKVAQFSGHSFDNAPHFW
jgi:hypothetical protein